MNLGKNIYLMGAIILFIPLTIVFFQNATLGYQMAFLFKTAGSIASFFWFVVLMAAGMGACILLYVQKILADIEDSANSG
jgi:hypothetical protein